MHTVTLDLPQELYEQLQDQARSTARGLDEVVLQTLSHGLPPSVEEDLPSTLQSKLYEHVQLDASDVPVIAGTTMKVIELVVAQIAHGWSPEELHFQHPYLTMSQIHSALAYYWDHKEVLDADIERRWLWAERARQEAGPSPLVAKLQAQGLLQ